MFRHLVGKGREFPALSGWLLTRYPSHHRSAAITAATRAIDRARRKLPCAAANRELRLRNGRRLCAFYPLGAM
ncbi:hypothetical protein BQ8482_150103 [Mesorhizobium delmotii]|uniref:Uncharacterized protein n=1 Tax=Mesorhizobium delmotii TaxID=1631247 RepID=A0A2P9AHD6_9HYPH|nr:hypothetical protein BQ8482_150103 [Mesorhizobium delmotii]